ncbi:nitroreductase [Methanolobus vulcani]|uniref:Nitroreductase family protein n=1 Tax=Methanolobus vulcani TaxID=38026 RepID=A0A7Z8KQA2_9EURY|nr:nitroreductase [Methanolobus vulcani]TQD27673.1 nitroreductase family protein [Methanolobus vulcani]
MPEVIDTILSRRSIRKYTDEAVDDEDIITILEAAKWAPSGLNNQPWKFIVIKDKGTMKELAGCTHYSEIVMNAPLLIAVHLDTETMYNKTKDIQAIGAAIQNMLLACCDLGLGAVWLGEILNQSDKVNLILNCPDSLELMAVLAIGKPDESGKSPSRKELEDMVFSEKYGEKF